MVLTKNKKARGYQQSQNKCGPNICTTMKKVIVINLYITRTPYTLNAHRHKITDSNAFNSQKEEEKINNRLINKLHQFSIVAAISIHAYKCPCWTT